MWIGTNSNVFFAVHSSTKTSSIAISYCSRKANNIIQSMNGKIQIYPGFSSKCEMEHVFFAFILRNLMDPRFPSGKITYREMNVVCYKKTLFCCVFVTISGIKKD